MTEIKELKALGYCDFLKEIAEMNKKHEREYRVEDIQDFVRLLYLLRDIFYEHKNINCYELIKKEIQGFTNEDELPIYRKDLILKIEERKTEHEDLASDTSVVEIVVDYYSAFNKNTIIKYKDNDRGREFKTPYYNTLKNEYLIAFFNFYIEELKIIEDANFS